MTDSFLWRRVLAAIAVGTLVAAAGVEAATAVFRFDERLAEAGQALLDSGPTGPLHRVPVWRAESALTPRLETDGTLFGKAQPVHRYFTNSGLGIRAAEASILRIRMRVSGTEQVEVAWKMGPSYWRFDVLNLPVEDDGAWRVYEIETLRLVNWEKEDRVVDEFRFRLPRDAEFEVDFVDVLTRREALAQETAGQTPYRIGRSIRNSLYVQTPRELRYRLTVPEGGLFHSHLAVVEAVEAVFSLHVDGVEYGRVSIDDPSAWHAMQADLSVLAGETVEVSLRVESAGAGQVGLWGSPVLYRPGSANHTDSPLNVLIYLVDCLRADHLPVYGYERDTAPAMTAFAGEGVRFAHCFSAFSSTKASMASMFTSVYPWTHRALVGSRPIPPALDTLAEQFRAMGYETGAVTENLFTGTATNLERGYSYLEEMWQVRPAPSHTHATAFLEANRERPFFLFVHTMEPHQFRNEHEAPEAYRGLFVGEGVERDGVTRYDQTIRYADDNFKRVLDKLDELGLAETTLVIFTADHGEAFGEHGFHLHSGRPYNHQVHVPLLMRLPGRIEAGSVREQTVTLLDVAPTLSSFAGVAPSAQYAGRDLRALIEEGDGTGLGNRPVYAWGMNTPAIIEPAYKLMRMDDRGGELHLFDRREDYAELNNLAQGRPGVRDRMAAALEAFLSEQARLAAALEAAVTGERAAQVDALEIELLEALGYLD